MWHNAPPVPGLDGRPEKEAPMPDLSDREEQWLAEISRDRLWQHAATLARWEKVSGTPGERVAVGYLQQQLEAAGIATKRYEFESLLGWPEEAALEVRAPAARSLRALTHAFTPSTAPEGVEAELVDVGVGNDSDYRRDEVAGKVALVQGMPSPAAILRGQQHGVAGQVCIQGDRLHDLCVSPVWGTPTTRTADLLPKHPVVSVSRSDGDGLKELLRPGPVRIWLKTKTFWDWRTVPLLTGDIPGAIEPKRFVLLSGHHCSWYYGAMDNGAADATLLEVARVLAGHRDELRRGIRVAFWPGHTQGRYSGSTWYFDNFWEDLHDNCVLHVNADSTGARGATIYHAMSMPETREFARRAIHDAIGVDAEPERQSRAGDQSFWACGIPSTFMDLSSVPAELAVDLGGTSLFTAPEAAGKRRGGMPWWWHTPDDTIDKLDPEVLARDTRVYLLATARAATEPVLPFRYAPAARDIRTTLERYQAAAGDRFDLGPALARARAVEEAASALDDLLDRLRRRPQPELVEAANRGALALDRALVLINFTANGPFDQDLAVPIPAAPLLEPARRLADLDPSSSEARFLVTELTRNRNKVAFYLREALDAAESTIAGLGRLENDG
jgi:Iap family predicted aminopeptidase